MTHDEAADVAAYAKSLFPVTSAARIESIGVAMLEFSNPAFARQCLLHHSQNAEVLSIPTIRGMLDAEQHRQGEAAKARIERVLAEAGARRDRQRTAYAGAMHNRREEIDAFLADFTDADLAALQVDVAEHVRFQSEGAKQLFLRASSKTNIWVRMEIYDRVTKATPRTQQVASNIVANVAGDFDLD